MFASEVKQYDAPMNKIEILYADSKVIVVNKPEDVLSVPGRGPDKQDSVISRVQQSQPTARIVHRLDCATSGLMVLAQTADSHRELSRQFHDREVSKRYIAVVAGHLAESEGEVNLPLMTDWPNRPRQMVSAEGKQALTYYKEIEKLEFGAVTATRVELKPITGRSHQLRVHMLALGHPILGDNLYAEGEVLAASPRLLLHAQSLVFKDPDTHEPMEFECDAPF